MIGSFSAASWSDPSVVLIFGHLDGKKKKKKSTHLIDYSQYWKTGESYYLHAQIVSVLIFFPFSVITQIELV